MCGRKSVFEQCLSLPLFGKHAFDLLGEFGKYDEIPKRDFWVSNFDKTRQIAPGLRKLCDVTSRSYLPCAVHGLFDVLSEIMVALPRLTGGNLESDCIEGRVIPGTMTSYKSSNVLTETGHHSS
jgi:hypothetical protein